SLSLKSLLIPSGIYFDDAKNRLWIINRAQQQIEAYLKNGNIDKIVKLPSAQFNRIFIAEPDIYVFNKMNSQISRIQDQSMIEYFIPGQKNILNFFIYDSLMLILKPNGMYLYQIDK
ncbi:MAG: hypothetical protein KGZ86_07175, partial [Candidatus Latescibacteria bacterium]|nr:hypothetical protein [Candidatus Latescibacterota bacterium]